MEGAALAARYGALSCDHIEHLSEHGIDEMKKAGTVAVLLPGAFYTLRDTKVPPIEELGPPRSPDGRFYRSQSGDLPCLSLLLMANMAYAVPSDGSRGFGRHHPACRAGSGSAGRARPDCRGPSRQLRALAREAGCRTGLLVRQQA